MKTEQDVQDFQQEAQVEYLDSCSVCHGLELECKHCWPRYNMALRAFEAGIPRDFWDYTPADIHHNKEQWEQVVEPYSQKLGKALKRGYGLIFLGDNGVGKTMFMCMVLMAALRRNFSAFYTTMLELDHTIKRGFNDRSLQERLDWYLTSDFLAIDELGKEQFKSGDSFSRTQVERILKRRFDDARPTLIATNATLEELESDDMYGATFASIAAGKYREISMDPGDYREQMRKRMMDEMK